MTTQTRFFSDDDIIETGPTAYVVAPMDLSNWVGTSSHICVLAVSPWASETSSRVLGADRTSWPSPYIEPATSRSKEVERLRDEVSRICGLSRQDIARAMGIDRRSLSGFVSGEIQPTQERLTALRVLTDAAKWTAERFGKRAREVLTAEGEDGCPLDLVAMGFSELRSAIESAAHTAGVVARAPVNIRHRPHREPLYLRARGVWSDRSDLPTRAGQLREPEVYEQDLAEATATTAREGTRRRRKSI